MKTAIKHCLAALLLSGLVACGGEEEITYEPTPFDLPAEYVLTEEDTAPAFYSSVMDYVAESVIQPVEEVEEVDEDAPPIILTKEEEKAAEAEAEMKAAAWEAELAEITVANNKLMSIRLVSLFDPSESNATALTEAQAAIDEAALAAAEADAEARAAAQEAGEPVGGSEDGVTEAPLSSETEEVEEEEPASLLDTVPQDAYIYTYDTSTTGKTGGQATAEYVTHMQGNGFKIIDAFHPVEGEYYEMVTPDFTQRAGTVAMARNLSVAGRLFMVLIDWNQNGAVVTVYSEPGTLWIAPKVKPAASKGALSIEDAVTFLGSRDPSDLGLTGTSMTEYSIYTAEGLLMINGQAYRQFNIAKKSTTGGGNEYAGSYLIESEGNTFKMDQVTGTVIPLQITNVYDTLD